MSEADSIVPFSLERVSDWVSTMGEIGLIGSLDSSFLLVFEESE
jgi:hypothetical protein